MTHFIRKIKHFILKFYLEGDPDQIALRSILPHLNLKDWQERMQESTYREGAHSVPMESIASEVVIPDSSSYPPIHKRRNNHIYLLHQIKDENKCHLEMCHLPRTHKKWKISVFILNMHICKPTHTNSQPFSRLILF